MKREKLQAILRESGSDITLLNVGKKLNAKQYNYGNVAYPVIIGQQIEKATNLFSSLHPELYPRYNNIITIVDE